MLTSLSTAGAFLKGMSLRDQLIYQTLHRPDATAVTHQTGDLTFAQLSDAAHRVGGHLVRLGVAPDTCVGVFAEPSAELMTAVWGILTAGAAYLPLSPDYPEDRLAYMLENSGTKVVITQEHLRGRAMRLAPRDVTVITDADMSGIPGERLPEIRGDRLAYVIYTSGSTGRPKGVMIEHRAIVAQLRWLASCGHLGRQVSILQKTPMSFDAAQWEILAPAMGARVVTGAPGLYCDPEGIIDAVREHRVTALQAVPTLLQALVATERLETCRSLRQIFSGGEALARALARDLHAALPEASVVNLYGPTETTINATAHWIDPDTLGESSAQSLSPTVPIGVPVDNVTCYILDGAGRPVDIGETGELFIGGVQVARGYIGDPEETRKRFITSPFNPTERLYRTGDLCEWNSDGTIQFVGRTDHQIKLRGYRVELEEVARRVEEHLWVRRAAVVAYDHPHTGAKALTAVVELDERTAAVMDQGRSDAAHHLSKASKLQVRAQLSNPGLRDPEELRGRQVVPLPGGTAADRQERAAFARKTYRTFGGGPVTAADVLGALAAPARPALSRTLTELSFAEFGEILRWFGPHHSTERLLPKYLYASPGALYATQMYIEIDGLFGLSGCYYHHPVDHTLVRVGEASRDFGGPGLRLHFLGKKRAVEPVYKNNIAEVLALETGHMIGAFEELLPEYGLAVIPAGFRPQAKDLLDAAGDDLYLGAFAVVENLGQAWLDRVELFVHAHGERVAGLEAGLYRYRDGRLVRVGADIVEKRHVIAINQSTYEGASFGVSAVSRAPEEWLRYIVMGAKLHHLQSVPGMGFMSAGYSSESGDPLPASRRLDDLLGAAGLPAAPASYYFVGGAISAEQAAHRGMNEDAVHAQGPAEMIRKDLVRALPDYMIPTQVLVVGRLPLTANGKIDLPATAELPEVVKAQEAAPYVAPATPTERWLTEFMGRLLSRADVSVQDDFFTFGGNSMHALALVNEINREFGVVLPQQAIFESPVFADLAARIDGDVVTDTSRLVPLSADGPGTPVLCWPGLGGYPLNLRLLAQTMGVDRPVYGIQAHGVNAGETPFELIRDMAMADLTEIRRIQPSGPYTLLGYSFGARVAFEVAWRLEQLGEKVANLLLVCPGNPTVPIEYKGEWGRVASYANPEYVAILFSVFAGTLEGAALGECLEKTRDERSFVGFIHDLMPALDSETISRIARVVAASYDFEYSFVELRERTIEAPITIFKARGDDYSFIEESTGYYRLPPEVVELEGDHYTVLRTAGVGELAARIRSRMEATRGL
ncbi:amino acid adenylation domain-containing protein [Spongiactinospora sp. TRM90649]|uniref:non-ribosomal peptide synthetase family protein n=1 Tax=Spongiactinospora sp. TRM90649 TaxID=3031114 RepID=UPI0023F8DF60|nr:amino acid adenylation domain-containing protein [Spongiactinospora sp. TRM90649]MDF5753537.1 amino acid adenylation domain-containing protein [Spongiactinospora sp. TRM90649]